ncbi:metallopeptidase family protein [Corynebacterium phoceense]|uniref:metallopeptidase family protein n=1 Tax=Corynebacterium phoceense TaxID=1686286 RepID=UPI001E1AB974|nr:metallopeptidase family protein [Corynebacterium phoceense]MCQ9334940.1 metallopeptidase family protein [Corynebacterium phoceense]MCQ9336723.1 metallopeptidase family protein [Corynebacterium phoceense]HJG43238.1 metallopeptidase family protein [Corynebacterium phoceense]
MYYVEDERFDEMVEAALDKVPENFVARMRNLAILVEDYNEDSPHILGLYEGVALPERTFDHTGYLPDAIFIYRRALQDWCNSEEELEHQVMVTVFHELGHYFGIDDEHLHELGWG